MASRGVGWIMLGLGHRWGVKVPAQVGCQLFSRGGRCEYIAPLHPRPSVCGEEAHPLGRGLVFSEHRVSGGVNLEK